MDNITVLIPTSPIPSHPSTAILDETIENIRKYTDARIIIMFDGVHKSLAHREGDYKRYIDAVHEKLGIYGDCAPMIFSEHTHQAAMTRIAMKMVSTPLILFCEHDTSPIGDIPFKQICNIVELTGDINYVRFNIFHTILEEHKHLMLNEVMAGNGDCWVNLTRTIQWSQRPHIAKTEWYREILTTCFKPEEKTMIEDIMHSRVIEAYEDYKYDFGLTIYTPEGNQLRSYHSDGRKQDEKIITG